MVQSWTTLKAIEFKVMCILGKLPSFFIHLQLEVLYFAIMQWKILETVLKFHIHVHEI